MCRFRFSLMAAVILVTSSSAFSQTYTTGREDAKADVNFTEIANYYAAHPEPLHRKALFDEDGEEDERPDQPEPNASLVHMIHRNTASGARGAHGALLPVSVAPADTFLSTISDGTSIPPDTHGEVDSNYCVTAINSVVHIQKRTGANVSTASIDAFWHTVLPHGAGSFDPRAHYDPHYHRWIMVCDAYGQSANSQIMIAVSATSNPTGTWHMYSVLVDPTGANWLDFPCVGFNGRWITVTGNLYSNSGGGSNGAVVYVFNYASIMAGTGAPYTKISESSSFTLCPAQTYDTTEQNMFLLEVNNGGSGKLQLWKLTGAVGSPVIASVGYPATTQHWHGSAGSGDFTPQLGTTNKLQAGDNRITSVTQRNNSLWCAHTVFLPDPGGLNRCSVMWWQIDTLGNPVQNGLIDDPATPSFFDYPTLTVNKNNDVLIGFSYQSANIYPSAAYALHLHTDPNDSIRPPHIFRHGQANYYETFGGTQNRWGDYSSTCVDPLNNVDFWTIQESVPASPANVWDTWWAYISVCPAAATFTVAHDSINNGSYDTLTFTGTAPTGSTYSWNFGGGTATPGTGAGPQHVKWTTSGWKVVTLSVTDSGCTSTITDSIFVRSTTGINETSITEHDLKIVPNPSDGSFDVISGQLLNKSADVKIIDMQGRLVYQKQFDATNSNTLPIRANNLASGNYIIAIGIDGTSTKTRITIER